MSEISSFDICAIDYPAFLIGKLETINKVYTQIPDKVYCDLLNLVLKKLDELKEQTDAQNIENSLYNIQAMIDFLDQKINCDAIKNIKLILSIRLKERMPDPYAALFINSRNSSYYLKENLYEIIETVDDELLRLLKRMIFKALNKDKPNDEISSFRTRLAQSITKLEKEVLPAKICKNALLFSGFIIATICLPLAMAFGSLFLTLPLVVLMLSIMIGGPIVDSYRQSEEKLALLSKIKEKCDFIEDGVVDNTVDAEERGKPSEVTTYPPMYPSLFSTKPESFSAVSTAAHPSMSSNR